MPRIVVSTPREAIFPKYLALTTGQSRTLRYGPAMWCLLIADVTPAEHTALTANADVSALPANLDTAVTNGARVAIVNALEAANIPAQWVANGLTFRVVLRRLVGIFEMLKNVQGRGLTFLQSALTSTISSLPANVVQAMRDAATYLQLDTSAITGATTLRAALTTIGSQFDSRPVLACGVSL